MSAIIFLATLTQITTASTLTTAPVAQVTPAAIVRREPLSNQSVNPQEQLERGLVSYRENRFREAVQFFQEASTAFQTREDGLNQALALNYLSLAYQQLGQLTDAEIAIAKSLTLLKNTNGTKNYLSVRAQALNTQGKLQLAQGKAELALKSWEAATKIYTQIQDQVGIIGSQINQTQALQALGFYHRAQNILENLQQTLDQQPNSLLKIQGLLSIANTWRAVGNLKQSQEILESAKKLAVELNSPDMLAEIYLSLGNTYQALANNQIPPDEKLTALTEKAYMEVVKNSTSPTLQVQAQLNTLRLLVDRNAGDRQQISTAPQLSSIISQIEQLPLSRQKVYARINLAQTLIKLQQNTTKLSVNPTWEDIAQIVKTGIKEAKILADTRAEAYALGTLGTIKEKDQKLSEAQQLSEAAVTLAEGIFASDIAYRWRWQLGRIYQANGNYEQAKGSYKQALKHLKSLRNDLAYASRDVQFSFRAEVEPVYREYVSLLLPPTASGEVSQENLQQAIDVMESLKLAELDSFFLRACLTVDDQPVSLYTVDPKAAIIYPIILSDRLAVIVSLPNQKNYKSQFKQANSQSKVTLKLEQYFFGKDKTFSSTQQFNETLNKLRTEQLVVIGNPDYLKSLQDIYKLIISPFEEEFENHQIKNLVFVLDGSLRNIPMAALYDANKQQFLIEKSYDLAISPGLKLLPPEPSNIAKLKLFAGGLSEINSNISSNESFNNLENVQEEINQVTQNLPGSKKLLNNQFTNKEIAQGIKSFSPDIVLFATHGRFSSNAEDTFILSWDKKINANDLGALLKSQRTLKNRIDLLILSACQTASGDERAGLGLAGVAIQSGARSTVATLWSVDDEATKYLVVEFFQQLKNNSKITKAEALKKAQLSLIKNKKHPYYWAPYILVGNWL